MLFCQLFSLMATLKFNSRGLLENHQFLHTFFFPSSPLLPPSLPLFPSFPLYSLYPSFHVYAPMAKQKLSRQLGDPAKVFFPPTTTLETALETRWFIKRRAPPWKSIFWYTLVGLFFTGVKLRSKFAENYSFSRWRDLNVRPYEKK